VYCDEYVGVCVCISVCPREYFRNHPRDLYQIFVHVAYGRVSAILQQGDEIPRGRGNFGGLGVFPIDNVLYSIACGTRAKTDEPIEMPFRIMSGLGPRNSVLHAGDDPRRGSGNFWGNMCPTSLTLLINAN